MQDRKTQANLLTDDMTAENSEESKKKKISGLYKQI